MEKKESNFEKKNKQKNKKGKVGKKKVKKKKKMKKKKNKKDPLAVSEHVFNNHSTLVVLDVSKQ